MTTSSDHRDPGALTSAAIEKDLTGFLEGRTRVPVTIDLDLFASGTISSMFAMELVVYLEQAFGVEIGGRDLRMDNFRTVAAMSSLVLRLRMVAGADDSD